MGDNSDCTVLEFLPSFANKKNIIDLYKLVQTICLKIEDEPHVLLDCSLFKINNDKIRLFMEGRSQTLPLWTLNNNLYF